MDGFVHGMTAAGLLMTVDASMIWCVMVDYTVERPEARPDYTRPVHSSTYWPEASLTHARDPAPVAHQCGPSAKSRPAGFSPPLPLTRLFRHPSVTGAVQMHMHMRQGSPLGPPCQVTRLPVLKPLPACTPKVRAATKQASWLLHTERGNKKPFQTNSPSMVA